MGLGGGVVVVSVALGPWGVRGPLGIAYGAARVWPGDDGAGSWVVYPFGPGSRSNKLGVAVNSGCAPGVQHLPATR